MTCPEVARLLRNAPRSVEYWVHRFQRQGLGGLTEAERLGRSRRLNEKEMQEKDRVERHKPTDAGLHVNMWDGKTLSAWINKTFGIELKVRQCQRWFRRLGFRLRKPCTVFGARRSRAAARAGHTFQVSLKVARPEAYGEEALLRFQQGREILATIQILLLSHDLKRSSVVESPADFGVNLARIIIMKAAES